MRVIETQIMIDAPAGAVWDCLLDFESFPSWNPFIVQASGRRDVGQKLDILLESKPGSSMGFKPIVLVKDSGREFRWRGTVLFKGLFDGEHYFKLEAIDGATRLIHGEQFSGLLVPLMGGLLKDTEANFEKMNRALKARLEA